MHPLTRWSWHQMIAWALTDVDALRAEYAKYVRRIKQYHA